MTLVYVLIPVLARPERVEPLLESLRRSERDATLLPLFLASPDDREEIAAIRASEAHLVVVPWECGPGDYARKINLGARIALEDGADWVFTGADDLCFCDGAFDEAVRVGVTSGRCVVGTDDLGNALVRSGRHSTHSLVRIDYLAAGTIDEPGLLLHEGYDHQFVDVELVATAIARDEWVFARDAKVEHLHTFWGKSANDSTYEKATRSTREDLRVFQLRQRLWASPLHRGWIALT